MFGNISVELANMLSTSDETSNGAWHTFMSEYLQATFCEDNIIIIQV